MTFWSRKAVFVFCSCVIISTMCDDQLDRFSTTRAPKTKAGPAEWFSRCGCYLLVKPVSGSLVFHGPNRLYEKTVKLNVNTCTLHQEQCRQVCKKRFTTVLWKTLMPASVSVGSVSWTPPVDVAKTIGDFACWKYHGRPDSRLHIELVSYVDCAALKLSDMSMEPSVNEKVPILPNSSNHSVLSHNNVCCTIQKEPRQATIQRTRFKRYRARKCSANG